MVSLAGRTSVGRGGVSLLTNLGLPQFIAATPEKYLQIARDAAADLPTLAELRRGLRAKMQASVICDASAHARRIVNCYRQIWRTWCETQCPPSKAST